MYECLKYKSLFIWYERVLLQNRLHFVLCVETLTVVRYLKGVLALCSLAPAAHRGESPVLIT